MQSGPPNETCLQEDYLNHSLVSSIYRNKTVLCFIDKLHLIGLKSARTRLICVFLLFGFHAFKMEYCENPYVKAQSTRVHSGYPM